MVNESSKQVKPVSPNVNGLESLFITKEQRYKESDKPAEQK